MDDLSSVKKTSKREETILEFNNRVEMAKLENAGSDRIFVEASDKILALIMPRGLGEAGYFNYKDVYVVPEGKTEEVSTKLDLTREELAHGKNAVGKIIT